MSKKTKTSEGTQYGTPKAVVIDNVARHMISKRVYPVANTMFPEDFVVYSPEPGESIIYRVVNEQMVFRKLESLPRAFN
jgi:hypothetical protein